MRIRALFPKFASLFGLVEQAFWRMPFFTEGVVQVPSGQSLHGSRAIFPLGLLPLGLLVLDAFLTLCCVEDLGEEFGCVDFCALIHIVTGTAIVSFRTLPVGFSLPTISWTSLFTLFYTLILDHGVSFIISVPGLKILNSQILLDISFHHCLQSVIIRSSLLLMNLRNVQFQYGLEFLRLSYSEFVQAFQNVLRWDLCHRK